MARQRGPRLLVADQESFQWSVKHAHERPDELDTPRYEDCREIVSIRHIGSNRRLDIVFRTRSGQPAPGEWHTGAVVRTDVGALNLNEPGVIRAFLDEALARRDWQLDTQTHSEIDGWPLFNAVYTRRPSA